MKFLLMRETHNSSEATIRVKSSYDDGVNRYFLEMRTDDDHMNLWLGDADDALQLAKSIEEEVSE